MAALTMILAAVMVVPGDGPEKVSADIAPQKLDLSGKWEGTWRGTFWKGAEQIGEATLDEESVLNLYSPNRNRCVSIGLFKIDDVGDRKLRIQWGEDYLGLYRRRGEHIVICMFPSERGFPSSYQAGKNQHLLILHRVKSSK
jgi:hypothetical protein